MSRIPALALSLALAACTAGPMHDTAPQTPSAAAMLPPADQGPAVPEHVEALISLDETGVRDLIGEPAVDARTAGVTFTPAAELTLFG